MEEKISREAHDRKDVETGTTLGRYSPHRLILLVSGTIVLIFGTFEIVERTWLATAEMQLIHMLHILRGVGSTLIVAALISWSLLKSSPPLLAPTRQHVRLDIRAAERDRRRIQF